MEFKMRSTLLVFLLSYSLSVLASSNLSVFEHTGKKHELSREQLLQLPQTEITTALPWSEGESVYGGVTLLVVFTFSIPLVVYMSQERRVDGTNYFLTF